MPTITIGPNSDKQAEFLMSTEDEVLYGGSAGSGKQLSLETLIPTIDGMKKMGELQAGDYVLSPSGKPVQIIFCSDIDYNPNAYELEFDTGEKIQADARHLWKTLDIEEREQQSKLTDKYRKWRRERRPSRAIANPQKAWVQKSISKINSERQYVYKEPPTGTIRTTEEIFCTQRINRRNNHSVDVTKPVDLPEVELPIEPYLLGLWLGDGHSNAGMIGMARDDMEVLKSFFPEGTGYKVDTRNRKTPFVTATVYGMIKKIRNIGCYKNKHIPALYLRSSFEQRLALIQGIMDTDGTVDKTSGSCEIGLSNRKLIDDVLELLSTLGIKGSVSSKKAKIYGRYIGETYRIIFMSALPMFRLQRKLAKQKVSDFRDTVKRRYIISVKKISPVPMKCIQVANPDGMYLVGRTMIATHNSMLLCIDPLRYIQYPDFKGIIFRRTFPQLEGSILPFTQKYYPSLGGEYNVQSKQWKFPSGAAIRLGYMQYEHDWMNYQGHNYNWMGFDELTTFLWKQVESVTPWLRSGDSRIPAYFRATTNPGGVSHAQVKREFVEPCRPINDGPRVYSELAQMWHQPVRSGKAFKVHLPDGRFISRRFIPARIFDNEDLLRNDPKYLSKLLRMGENKRKAFLEGDWDIFEGQFFPWSEKLHIIPPRVGTPPSSWKVVGGLDYGQITVLEVQGISPDGTVFNFAECTSMGESPEEKAEEIARFLIDRKINRLKMVYDHDMIGTHVTYGAKQSVLKIFKITFRKMMGDRSPVMVPMNKRSLENVRFRVACNEIMKNYLSYKVDPEGKLIKPPKFLVTSDCKELIRTLPELVHDPDSMNGMDFEDSDDDHWYDSSKMSLVTYARVKIQEEKKQEQRSEWYDHLIVPQVQGVSAWRNPFDV